MPTVKTVERKIGDVEGFDIIIRQGGADVRGDKILPKQYPYNVAAKGNYTVAGWISKRFTLVYPGYEVDVLNSEGEKVIGNTLLSTVRDSYTEE